MVLLFGGFGRWRILPHASGNYILDKYGTLEHKRNIVPVPFWGSVTGV
jgi:hypothetical protein